MIEFLAALPLLLLSFLLWSSIGRYIIPGFEKAIKGELGYEELFGYWIFYGMVGAFLIAIGSIAISRDPIIGGGLAGFGAGFLLSPFYVRWKIVKERENRETIKYLREMDTKVMKLARKFHGILTVSILVDSGEFSLEEANKALERFIKLGEAKVINTSFGRIYDFPSARMHLAKMDQNIIAVLLKNPEGLSISQLIKEIDAPLESIQSSLTRLESLGIVVRDNVNDLYKLRALV